MTTLYRSPNVIVDRFEWHIAVTKRRNVTIQYYFRPLSLKQYHWQPITSWKGTKPRALYQSRIRKYLLHARTAVESEEIRRFAVGHLPRHGSSSLVNMSVAEAA